MSDAARAVNAVILSRRRRRRRRRHHGDR